MGILDFLKKDRVAVVEKTSVSTPGSLDEVIVEGNDVEATGLTMEEIENLVSKVLSKSNNNSSNEMRFGTPTSGSTPEKVLFKGFKQLLAAEYANLKTNYPEELSGILSFVRESATSEEGTIYLGTRKYSSVTPRVIDCGEY